MLQPLQSPVHMKQMLIEMANDLPLRWFQQAALIFPTAFSLDSGPVVQEWIAKVVETVGKMSLSGAQMTHFLVLQEAARR